MHVDELVHNRTPVTVRETDDLALARQAMLWADIRHLPVLDERDHLVGVISERDILGELARRGRTAARERVGDVMSKPPIVVTPHDTQTHAVGVILERRVGCLPVVERGKLVGIVTRTDVLRHLEDEDQRRVDGPRLEAFMKRAPATAASDDVLFDAVARMESLGVAHIPVVDGDRRVVGMLSERDVRSAIGDSLRPLRPSDGIVRLRSLRVSDVMTRDPITVEENTSLHDVAQVLATQRAGAVAVVDEASRLVGVISYVDVLKGLLQETHA